jgi:hypothetical protein
MSAKNTAAPTPPEETAPPAESIEAQPKPTVDEAIQSLIAALGVDARNVAKITVSSQGHVQIYDIDRALIAKSIKELRRWRRDRWGFIIPDPTEEAAA